MVIIHSYTLLILYSHNNNCMNQQLRIFKLLRSAFTSIFAYCDDKIIVINVSDCAPQKHKPYSSKWLLTVRTWTKYFLTLLNLFELCKYYSLWDMMMFNRLQRHFEKYDISLKCLWWYFFLIVMLFLGVSSSQYPLNNNRIDF